MFCNITDLDMNYCMRRYDNALEITKFVELNIGTAITDKYHYDFSHRRVWDVRRRTIVLEYGDGSESYNVLLQLLNVTSLTILEQW